MIRDELVAGLKLSMERGESRQAAMQTFVNAGYSVEDVNESAAALTEQPKPMELKKEVISAKQEKTFQPLPKAPETPEAPASSTLVSKPEASRKMKIILLAAALIVIALLAVSVYLFLL